MQDGAEIFLHLENVDEPLIPVSIVSRFLIIRQGLSSVILLFASSAALEALAVPFATAASPKAPERPREAAIRCCRSSRGKAVAGIAAAARASGV